MTDRPSLRARFLTRAMTLASGRARDVEIAGLRLRVAPGVCHPAPAFGQSLASLFEAALIDVAPGERVLDLGTGCGIWALLAARAGADVTATDLPHVPLEPVRQAAHDNGLSAPRLLHGDLFAPVSGERFDRVLFNPPFHLGEPRTDAERAYLGGADGAVVRRFLAALPDHLAPGGRGFVVLPDVERRAYAADLASHRPVAIATRALPVLGRVAVLELAPDAARGVSC